MRKSNPFVAIPTVATTVSGQWLTFSHMANHYRKLLNVKPRVESNAPRRPSIGALQASPQKLTKKPRPPSRGTQRDSGVVAGHVVRKGTRKSPRRPPNAKSYQLIFDQSELNNLSEAVMSDSEVEGDAPNVHPMEISEKIRLYLDQLEETAFDESQSGRSLCPYAPHFAKESRKLDRHSQCFVPHVESSKRKSNTKIKISEPVLLKSKPHSASLTPKKGSMMQKTSFLSSRPKTNAGFSHFKSTEVTSSKTSNVFMEKPRKGFGNASKSKAPSKKAEKGGSCCSQNSASIGTVRGSEELGGRGFTSLVAQAKREAPSEKRKKERIAGCDVASPDWLPSRESSLRLHSANTRLKSSTSTLGFPNNKDSSRDSAYGFSSGESKITTRESTPEKQKSRKKVENEGNGEHRYKSTLSTVASSINQDSPANSFHQSTSPNSKDKAKAKAKEKKRTKNTNSNWMADDAYINFITAVTDDIVLREIFTNKGLKSLFHSHIEANRHLDMEKMLYMLDRLRMDVGVPKDDSLNQLEFGYGSINYSTPPLFAQLPQMHPHVHTEHPQKLTPTPTEVTLGRAPPITPGGLPTSADATLFELHRHNAPPERSSAEESSKASSVSASVFNGTTAPSHQQIQRQALALEKEVWRGDFKGWSPPSSKSSYLSLTQSQVEMALGEAGFDLEEALDIVRIVREGGGRGRRQKKLPLDLEPNNNEPFISERHQRRRSTSTTSVDSL